MDATKAARDRIMNPILGRLAAIGDEIQRALVQAKVTGKPVPALELKKAHLIAAMRHAAGKAVAQTPGLTRPDISKALAWRTAKVRGLSVIVKMEKDPALGTLLALSAQARLFGSDLTAKVSDTLVAAHTARQDAACGPGQVLIWEAERDACVRCLKYAGQYRAAGATFKAGQSFDPAAPRPEGTLPGPPLHPNCRCELAVIPRDAAPDNAKALMREAQRSILKGWALPSESDVLRSKAALALVNSNVIAPKSVIAETRKRLKSGEPFIRDVP